MPDAGAMPDRAMRPIEPGDDAFLDRLYAGTRIQEVLGWGLSHAEAELFLRDQGHLQRRSYAVQLPRAEHLAVLAGGQPAGRLIVNREPDGWRVVDLSIVPELRCRGLGTWALGKVLRRAQDDDEGRRVVRLGVQPANPARRLYERLGFRAVAGGVDGIQMEWRPASPASPA